MVEGGRKGWVGGCCCWIGQGGNWGEEGGADGRVRRGKSNIVLCTDLNTTVRVSNQKFDLQELEVSFQILTTKKEDNQLVFRGLAQATVVLYARLIHSRPLMHICTQDNSESWSFWPASLPLPASVAHSMLTKNNVVLVLRITLLYQGKCTECTVW